MSSHLDKPIIIGTHTGAPTAADGAFYLGYGWLDTNDNLWVCTAAGTPGTWVQMTGSAPGNATVSDVLSGKTFSSSSGLDQTGTYTAPVTGALIAGIGYTASGSGAWTVNCTLQNAGDLIILMVAMPNTGGNNSVASVSGCGATWSLWTYEQYSTAVRAEIWIGSGATSSGTITITPTNLTTTTYGTSIALEVAGVKSSSHLSASVAAEGSGSGVGPPSLTVPAGSLYLSIFAAAGVWTTSTGTASSGSIIVPLIFLANAANWTEAAVLGPVVSASTAYQPQFTYSGSSSFATIAFYVTP